MSDQQKVSIKTIAEKTGFSITTVSRVINSKEGFYTKETEEKILRTIEELNYYPNAAARGLRKKRTSMIGFLTHYLSLFWLEFFKGAEYEAFSRGYIILLCNTENNSLTEKSYISALIENRVSGVIISSVINDEKNVERLIEQGIPVITIVTPFTVKNNPYIKINTRDAMIKAVGHLKEKGYRSVGIIEPPIEGQKTYAERYEGYRLGLEKYGLGFDEQNVLTDDKLKNLSVDIGYSFMKDILKDKRLKAESYIIIPDSIAIGCMKAIKEAGYKIPGDIGIVGFDNIAMSSYCEPSLTTIEIPKFSMGRRATDIIIQLVEEGKTNLKTEYDLDLIVRESTNRK